jgi:hypothetical protein
MSGRKVDLDEVVEPYLKLESSAMPKDVPALPPPTREKANDDDHETLNDAPGETCRSTRTQNAPKWYGIILMNVMLLIK